MEIPEELLRASVHLEDARFVSLYSAAFNARRPGVEPTLVIASRVTMNIEARYATGLPVADASVAVKLADGVLALDLAGSWPSKFGGRTDAAGRLALDYVPALEPLVVYLLADGRWLQQSVNLDAFARVEFIVEAPLPEQQWTISGIVIDGLGKVVESALVGMPLASVRSDAAGRFELTLSAASVKPEDPLYAVAVGRGSRLEVDFGRRWIESGGSLNSLRLVLEAPRSLAGRVIWSDGGPAVGFNVQPDTPLFFVTA